MEFSKFERNLISVIKEAQIKLGYDKMPISINYILPSLKHLFNECEDDEIEQNIKAFAQKNNANLGEISIKRIDNGYRLTVSGEGAEYVHNLIDENEFLVSFINTVRTPLCTIDMIISVFKKYSDNVHIEDTSENGEFDYLIYFENGDIDEFWYCIDIDDLGTTYHRFTKEDYLDFNF